MVNNKKKNIKQALILILKLGVFLSNYNGLCMKTLSKP